MLRIVSYPSAYFDGISNQGSTQFPGPDPFAVLGLPASEKITIAGIRVHARKICKPHVLLRGDAGALTESPRVPTWEQINTAKDKLLKIDDRTLDATRQF